MPLRTRCSARFTCQPWDGTGGEWLLITNGYISKVSKIGKVSEIGKIGKIGKVSEIGKIGKVSNIISYGGEWLMVRLNVTKQSFQDFRV